MPESWLFEHLLETQSGIQFASEELGGRGRWVGPKSHGVFISGSKIPKLVAIETGPLSMHRANCSAVMADQSSSPAPKVCPHKKLWLEIPRSGVMAGL